MPRFSIVIPTQSRPDTLRYSLQTALGQNRTDIEIIVHESGRDPRVASVMAEVNDPRVRYFSTQDRVRMSENWERALRHTTGEYVFFMGDDDGLLPNACDIADRILIHQQSELLSWQPAIYFWPEFFDQSKRDMLLVLYGQTARCTVKDSSMALDLAYGFRLPYIELPMIYNSFVSRSIIERAYDRRQAYFVGSAPDTVSGPINLYLTRSYLRLNRPLSVSGVSHHSTGHRWFSGDRKLQEAARDAFGQMWIHPTMVASHNSIIIMGNELLMVKDAFFPGKPPTLKYRQMLLSALADSADHLVQYESTLEQCRQIAALNGVSMGDLKLPDRQTKEPTIAVGQVEIEPGLVHETVNGKTCGIANILDATRELDRRLSQDSSVDIDVVTERAQVREINPEKDFETTLSFNPAGNAFALLGSGWSRLEHWGVWSIGHRSELVLKVGRPYDGAITFRVVGQVFCPPRKLSGALCLNGTMLGGIDLTLANPHLDVLLQAASVNLATGDELQIVFRIDAAKTPAEIGLNADTRALGIGLQTITVSGL